MRKQKGGLEIAQFTDLFEGGPSNAKRCEGTKTGKYKTTCVVRKAFIRMGKMEWKKSLNIAKELLWFSTRIHEIIGRKLQKNKLFVTTSFIREKMTAAFTR